MAYLGMDFEGQRKSEVAYQAIEVGFAIIGLLVGYWFEKFSYSVYIWAAGIVVSIVVAVPAYPVYRKNPIKWLEEIPESRPPPSSRKKGSKHRR